MTGLERGKVAPAGKSIQADRDLCYDAGITQLSSIDPPDSSSNLSPLCNSKYAATTGGGGGGSVVLGV